MKLSVRKTVRWFLLAGGVGLGVAILLLIIKPTNPMFLVFLCPTSIVGLADPKTPLEKAVIGLIIFGGNFLLYGAFGAIAGLAAGESQD